MTKNGRRYWRYVISRDKYERRLEIGNEVGVCDL